LSALDVLNDQLGFLCHEVLGKEGSLGQKLLSDLYKIYVHSEAPSFDSNEIMYRTGQRDLILNLYKVIGNYQQAQLQQEEEFKTQPEV